MKLQIQDDHNRCMLMKEDRLTLLADYHTPEPHRHIAAHLIFALGGVMRCTVTGEKVRARGICIRAGVEHTIDTSMGMLLTMLIDPECAFYHILEEEYLGEKEYCVLPDRMIQNIQVYYRHCGSNVEELDRFVISLMNNYGDIVPVQKHLHPMTEKESRLLEKMRHFYRQIGRVGSVPQASKDAGFSSPAHFAAACLEIFGISIHDLLTGRRGCDVEMEVPEQGENLRGKKI